MQRISSLNDFLFANFYIVIEIGLRKKIISFIYDNLVQIKWGTSVEKTVYYDIYLTKKAKTEMPQFLFWSRVILMYPDSPEK